MEKLTKELKQRWTAMFTALATGDDVPPSMRLRTEGMMESALLLGQASIEELDRAMNRCYHGAFNTSITEDFGVDWREFYPFPQIPAMGLRAPVYPSTND
tara:strand:- start:38599 stop:38898 length:300 start_codon:yes stop_codon:yes gene_type:complete